MLGLAAHGQVPRKDGASSEPQACRLSYEPLECTNLEVVAEGDFRKELGDDQRAAKRRRVEVLAEQYLRGKPIYIRSVLGPFAGRWINPWDRGRSVQRKERNIASEATTPNGVAHHRTYVGRRHNLSDGCPEKSKAVRRGQMALDKEPPDAGRGERKPAHVKQKSMEANIQGVTVRADSNSQQAGRAVKSHRDVHTWLRKMSEAEADSHIEEEVDTDVVMIDRGTPSKMPQGHRGNRGARRNPTRNGKHKVTKEYEESWEPRRKARKKSIAISKSESSTRPSKSTHSPSPPASRADSVQPFFASRAPGKDRHWMVPEAKRSSENSAEYVEGFVRGVSETVAQSKSRKSPLEKQVPSQALPPSTHLPEFRFRRTRASDRLRHNALLTAEKDYASKTRSKKMKTTASAPTPGSCPQKPRGSVSPVSVPAGLDTAKSPRGTAEGPYTQILPVPAIEPPEQATVAGRLMGDALGHPADGEGPLAQTQGASEILRGFERAESQAAAAAVGIQVVKPGNIAAHLKLSPAREEVTTPDIRQPRTTRNGDMGPPPVLSSLIKGKKSAIDAAPLQDSNFCTQAAMVEAEQAFQAVLESPVKPSLMGPHSPSKGSPAVIVSPQRGSESIKLFQAFQTASDDVSDRPPISTQQLFDEADLNFASTVKKTKGKKRTSFAPSPTLEKGSPNNVDESREDLGCSTKSSFDVVALDTAHQSPAIVATPAAMTSISLSQPIKAAALTALPSNSRLLSPRNIDKQATVPFDQISKDGNASFEESTQLRRLESGLTLPDEELDATVSCLDSYLNTWKIEKEVKDIQPNAVPKSTELPDDSSFVCTSIKKSSFRARRGGLSYKPAGRLKP